MAQIGYFGTYARFTTEGRDKAASFLSADNIIGNPFTIDISYHDGKREAVITNPFGEQMGVLDDSVVDEIELCNAKGWTTVALLALVAFTEEPKPGYYWGQVAIISYDDSHPEEFGHFIQFIGDKLSQGIRPDLRIGNQGLQQIVAKNGEFLPSGREPLPKRKQGTEFVKTERSNMEHLVEEARKGNKGCSVLTIIFYVVLFVIIAFIVKSCAGL